MRRMGIGLQLFTVREDLAKDFTTILWCENGAMHIGTHPVDQVIVQLRDGTVEKYQVGAMATNEKQVSSGIMDAFVESIVTNTPPSISGEEGLKSLAVILAAFESQDSKRLFLCPNTYVEPRIYCGLSFLCHQRI